MDYPHEELDLIFLVLPVDLKAQELVVRETMLEQFRKYRPYVATILAEIDTWNTSGRARTICRLVTVRRVRKCIL